MEEEEKEIKDVLIQYEQWESPVEQQHKEQILTKLSEIIKQWTTQTAKKELALSEEAAQHIHSQLFTFGSQFLKASSKGGDIDIVCVAPKFVDRDKHFFQDLKELLLSFPNVKVTPVQEARVPLLKIVFDGLSIDMGLAKIDRDTIEENIDLLDNNILNNMDDQSARTIGGRRANTLILQAIKSQESSFRALLQCIKLWAKSKGINAQAMGYIGGISWAILVAYICKNNQNLGPIKLLREFFKTQANWNWETKEVKIAEIKEEPANSKNKDQWTDIAKNSNQKMHIITPNFPCQNSANLVTSASLDIMRKYFQEANEQVNAMPIQWNELFKKIDFFKMQTMFIEVDILGKGGINEFEAWKNYVESRIRMLSIVLDKWISKFNDYIYFHLQPVGFDNDNSDAEFSQGKSYFWGVKIKPDYNGNDLEFDFFPAIGEFIETYLWEERKKKGNPSNLNMRMYKIAQTELPPCVFDKKKENTQKLLPPRNKRPPNNDLTSIEKLAIPGKTMHLETETKTQEEKRVAILEEKKPEEKKIQEEKKTAPVKKVVCADLFLK